MGLSLSLSLGLSSIRGSTPIPPIDPPPPGYSFINIGSPASFKTIRVGSNSSSPRILIPSGV